MTKEIMAHFIKWTLLSAILLVILSGCSTISQQQPSVTRSLSDRQAILTNLQVWQIEGKIGIQTPNDSGSANVKWLQSGKNYTLTLLGPLGATQLTLTGSSSGVTLLTAEGKQYHANNPEQLLMQQWHWNLPVSDLPYWIKGLPSPNGNYKSTFDAQHRLASLTQHGWSIQYLSYQTNPILDLPAKISITSDEMKAKIIIYEWNTQISH
jgi:outer membrane lipoprotein LolB